MKIDHHIAALSAASLASAATPPFHPVYRRDIDGLRAIAVLAVVAFHAFPAWLHGGFIGVDIFFVISGYLISGILIKNLERDSFSFADFYARRIRRIFPALLLVVGSTLAFAWFALFPDEFKQLAKHVVGGAGFMSNFMFWNEVGYFDTAAETKPLLHLWSLAIEEQFYIAWPVLLLLAWKRRLNLLAVTAGLALLSFAINAIGISHHASATFYSPASRAWELLCGAMLASISLRAEVTRAAPRVSPALLCGAGLVLLALGLAVITRERHFPGWLALLPVSGAVLIIAAGPQAWLNRLVLSNRLLVWIGLISYPLYLWHWPLLSFAQIVESGTPSVTIRAVAIGTAVLLSALTYLLLERPLRARARGAQVAILCALMGALAAAGAFVYTKDGLPTRARIVDNQQNQKALILVEDTANAAACKQRYHFESMYEYCLLAKVDQAPTVALIGDSHGYHVVAGLTRYYSANGENLLFLGTRVPYWDLPKGEDGYQQATQRMLEIALETPSIRTVVFSSSVRFNTQTPETRAIVAAARATLQRFGAAGKRVIFMNDIPTLGFDPRSCIKRAGVSSSHTRSPCAMPRAEWERQTPEHEAIVKTLMAEFPMVTLFETAPHLCDAKNCRVELDGRLMYRDKHHLTYDGDLYIGGKYAEAMGRAK